MNTVTAFFSRVRPALRGIPKVPLMILLVAIFAAVFADVLALHNPEVGFPRDRLRPPFWQNGGNLKYPLGTDTMGRDVLTRIIYGTRISLTVAFFAVFLSACVGTSIGVCAGFLGGWLDHVLMRVTDAWMSIPTVMFGVLLSIVVGQSVFNIVVIGTIVLWSRYARVVRGETLSLKTRDFVHLASIAGVGKTRIMIRHIVPNVMNSVITLASLQVGTVIVMEASLTFLGVGVPTPLPAWGLMLSEGKAGLFTGQWWLIVFPGVAIALLIVSFNLLGDWLRYRLDPHLSYL